MQISVETLTGLERKMTISVPSEKLEEEVRLRLRNLARKVKINGFRPGKVPIHLVESKYAPSVRDEVAREMVQSSLYEALKAEALIPAGSPSITPEQVELNKDFVFSATFEVFPQFSIQELQGAELEIYRSEVVEADIDKMLEKLQDQYRSWTPVSRAVAMGDRVKMDFKGFLKGEAFAGGEAKDYVLTLGSGQMIPGFEEGLVGHQKQEAFKLDVKFPEDYNHKDLAGQDTVFEISISEVEEGTRPALDDEFSKKFNVQGGIEALRADIKANMVRELNKRLSSVNRERIFDALLDKNPIELPKVMVDEEIGHLQHEMYHQISGAEHHESEKIPDFPRELFEERAKRRVQLGLLCNEFIKKHQLKVDKDRVDSAINQLAMSYENPEELRAWYLADKQRLAEIEALVIEEIITEVLLKDATVVEKNMDYEAIMALNKHNPLMRATHE